jgi:hypothetical protein
MAGRDPLALARQMAEAWLARPDVVAKGAAARLSLGDLVMTFLPFAQGLAPALDVLDEKVAGICEEMDGITAKMQLIAGQDRQRRAARAELEERIRNPQRQVRLADVDEARVALLREALRTAGVAQAASVNGHGPEVPDG